VYGCSLKAQQTVNLWWAEEIAWRPPEEAFGDTDYVAIPRFPTSSIVVEQALTHYQEYFATEFMPSSARRYWTVLKRRSTRSTSSD
jgi:hypothetical protein